MTVHRSRRPLCAPSVLPPVRTLRGPGHASDGCRPHDKEAITRSNVKINVKVKIDEKWVDHRVDHQILAIVNPSEDRQFPKCK